LTNDYTRKEIEMTDYPDLETVITWHIANNFYPPLPGAAVELPSGRTWPAQVVVDDLKLWDLVDYEED